MKTITIKTQAELDALPGSFEEFTVIEIRSGQDTKIVARKAYNNATVRAYNNATVRAYNNATVVACDNATVVACDNATVVAYNNATVVACDNATVVAYNNATVVAYDKSTVVAYELSKVTNHSNNTDLSFYDNAQGVLYQDPDTITIFDKAHIIKKEDIIKPTFGDWLERGWVVADGIRQKLVSYKSQGEVTIYKTEDFLSKETFYVAQKGDKFAHAKTTAEAIKDLRYKIADRDASEFKHWKLSDIKTIDELIEAYRVITGACSEGTKMWCESRQLKDKYTIKEAIELTKDSHAGHTFAKFFRGNQ